MAEITASMVKALRDKTDAPMMDCKKALTEAEGDMGKAEEILRVRLGNKAGKAASKTAAEGTVAVAVSADGSVGAILEANCQTDFVGKSDDFVGLAKGAAEAVVAGNPADIAALASLPMNGKTVEEIRVELVGKIAENMVLRRFVRIETKGKLASYIHSNGKIGVLVDVVGGDETLGKDIAMHIAASKPVSLDETGVAPELIEKERRVASEKAAESGKPANIVEKMVEGSVQKFLKEVTLLNQPFVKDPSKTIAGLLKEKGASVSSFVLYLVGEGIEVETTDFAAEVAAQRAAAAAGTL